MKIVDMGVYKGDTMFIDTDGGERKFLHSSIVSQFDLMKGMEVPEAAFEQVTEENIFRKARERALYLFDRREYGYVELYKKLENNYNDEICRRVCDDLAMSGIVDDCRYADRLAEYYCERKKYGGYRAKQELLRRGLGRQVADEAVEAHSEEQFQRLQELIEEKYLRYLGDEKGDRKVRNALVRLGYSYGEIKEALAAVGDDEDDFYENQS